LENYNILNIKKIQFMEITSGIINFSICLNSNRFIYLYYIIT
jgi:hypothetical protein